jgi:hypothetical protein
MTPDPAGKPLLQEVLRLRAEFEESSARAYSSAAAKVTWAAGGESAPKKLRLRIQTEQGRVSIKVQADFTVAHACAQAQGSFPVGYFKRPIRTLALADRGLELKPTDMVSFIAPLGEDLSTTLFRPVYAEDDDQAGAPLAVVLAEACAAADARAAAAGGESALKKLHLSIDTGECRVVIRVKADGTVADACAAAERMLPRRRDSTGFKRKIRTLALADGRLEFNRTDQVSFIARLGEDLSSPLLRPVYVED